MQTLFEIGFLFAMFLPPLAVVAGALTLVLTRPHARPTPTAVPRAA